MFLLVWSCEVYVLNLATLLSSSWLLIWFAAHVYKAIDALPVTAHPMTQFTTGIMALQVSPSTSGMLILSRLETWKSCGEKNHIYLWFICSCILKLLKVFKLVSHCIISGVWNYFKPSKCNSSYFYSISGWEWISKGIWQRIVKNKVSGGFICYPSYYLVKGCFSWCLQLLHV